MHARIPRGRQGHLYLPELYSGSEPDISKLSVPLAHRWRPDQGLSVTGGSILSMQDLVGDWHQTGSAPNPFLTVADPTFGGKNTWGGGGTQYFDGATGTSLSGQVSILMVGLAQAQCAFFGNGASSDLLWYVPSPASVEFFTSTAGGPCRWTPGTNPFTNPFWVLVTDESTAAADACKIYFMDDMATPKVTGVSNWSTTQVLGMGKSTAGVGSLRGRIAEVAIWQGILSPSDRAKVKTYCGRYGL